MERRSAPERYLTIAGRACQSTDMRFPDWVAREGIPIKQVAERCGVSRPSVANARDGIALQTFDLSARLSAFTGGQCTLEEIADPTGETRARIAAEVVPWQRAQRAQRESRLPEPGELRAMAARVCQRVDGVRCALDDDDDVVLEDFVRRTKESLRNRSEPGES